MASSLKQATFHVTVPMNVELYGVQRRPDTFCRPEKNMHTSAKILILSGAIVHLLNVFYVYKKKKTARSTAQKKSVKMKGLLAFSAHQKSKSVTWYHQSGSITPTQCNYRTTYAEIQLGRNSVLGSVQNFDEYETVGNAEASGRSEASSIRKKRVSNYFFRYPGRFSRRAEPD